MNKPLPSSRLSAAGSREPARLDSLGGKSTPFQINLRFYRVMKPRRIYPLVVELPRASAKPVAGQAPVVVRPVITGAVVAPAEQALDLNAAGGSLTFQVTPLAKGKMVDSRVELSQHGRPVDAIPVKMKTKTQRMTWLLLLLTLILPSALLYYTSPAGRLTGDVPLRDYRVMQGPALQPKFAAAGGAEAAPAPAPAGPAAPAAEAAASQAVKMKVGEPREVLQYRISHVIHEYCPKPDRDSCGEYLGGFCESIIKKQPFYIVKEQPISIAAADDVVEWVAYWLGYWYQYLVTGSTDLYPAFYSAIGLAALTLLSLVTHRTVRGRVRRTGIRLAEGASTGSARLAVSREQSPAVVEATE